MKRYMIVYIKDDETISRLVVGETAATAVLAALLVKIDYWGTGNIVVREEPPQEYRRGDENITITVGPAQ